MEPVAAQLAAEQRKAFLLAGNATFTVVSKETGTRFTFRVLRAKPNNWIQGDLLGEHTPLRWFVSVLFGPDNTSDYVYLGIIDQRNDFKLTAKSRYRWGTACVDAFNWVWQHLASNDFEFWHAGTCGRCGRDLTDPESIARGLGPVCVEKG